jgi:hypothetical protein
VQRARALLEAGWLARPGLYLLGTELQPDWVSSDGAFDETWGEPPRPPDPRFQRPDEVRRVEGAAPSPDVRFHYREVAADHAVAAADLLPPTTQAYAVALCEAARYVRDRDPDRFHALYVRYLHTGPYYEGSGEFGYRCPAPDWEAAEARVSRDERVGADAVRASMALAVLGFVLLVSAFARARYPLATPTPPRAG